MDNTLSGEWTDNQIAIEIALNNIVRAKEAILDVVGDLQDVQRLLRAAGREEDADCLLYLGCDIASGAASIGEVIRRNLGRVSEIR